MIVALFQCEMTQREALMTIYQQNNGENWEGAYYWNTFIPICFWKGVECNYDQVYYLNFKQFGLTGPLPEVMDCFPHLKSLNLEYNAIEGPIPETLCAATHLQNLEATRAGFTGEIPYCMTQLPFLYYMQLGENALTGEINPAVMALTELRQLDLHCNDMYGQIPAELEQLANLKELNVRCNKELSCESGLLDRDGFYFLCGTEECECDNWPEQPEVE